MGVTDVLGGDFVGVTDDLEGYFVGVTDGLGVGSEVPAVRQAVPSASGTDSAGFLV